MSFLPAAKLKPSGGLLIVFMVVLAYLLSSGNALQRIDFLLYDHFLSWQNHQISNEIVVVAVDDASLHELGRWPWSRRRHAKLLDQLTEMQPRAVGFDILFSEPQTRDTTADQTFARALENNGKTVLAVAPSNPLPGKMMAEVLPLPELAAAAAGLGHVDIEIDPDGLCRSFHLYAGLGNAHWPSIAAAMLQAAGTEYSEPPAYTSPQPHPISPAWMRHGRYFIPYDTTPGAVPTISYVDVLEGSVDSDKVKDKYVLIGSTATGLGDVVSTPVSAEYQRMPGVELNAHILSGLLRDRLVTVLNPISCKLLTVSIAALAALMMVSTTFPVAMLLFITFTIGVLAFAGVLLIGWQQWFPPAAAIAPMILGFPLWGVWSLIQEKRTNQSLTVRMQHQALHHSATDLPNQYVLEENLRQLSAEPPDPGSVAALMIVHVKWPGSDGGMVSRSAGDQLLRAIAYRLSQTVRNDDLVAHLNGDDFGVLVKNLNDPEGALRVAQDIINALQRPVLANDKQIYLSPRMGLSLWPGESADGEALLRDAYIAMFRARVEQSSRTCVFSERIANEVQAHSRLEQALISAVERGEFEVYYQPQVLTRDGQIVGVEALLRWHNPKLGLVYPGTFIPVAEHNGLIGEIGNWVLRTACKQVHEWNQQHVGPLRLAVNLSPLQLSDANIVKLVKSALEDSGLPADLLELEVTESTLVQNMKEASSTLQKLKEKGVQLAIDDFGTGYSALSNLQHFPLDRIKIDQSFTREIEANGNVREITLTIINMAKRLELEVIAEGVETESQAVFLSQSGCDELQGFYFGHPLPASKIASLLHERTFLRGDSAREHTDDDSLRRGA